MAAQKNLERRILVLGEHLANLQKEYRLLLTKVKQYSPQTAVKPKHSKAVPSYILMPQTSTYALSVHALQDAVKTGKYPQHPLFTLDDGSKIARPLTFKENMEKLVNDYNALKDENGRKRTEQERLKLFTERWKDSCMGVAYKAKSTKFKVIPVSKELITIPWDFSKDFLLVNYDSMQGTELDSSKGKYNQLLSQAQHLEQPAWNEAVADKALLKEYSDIVYSQLKQDAMGFWVRQNTDNDELRTLFLGRLGGYSLAIGLDDLILDGSFLLVAHEKKFHRK